MFEETVAGLSARRLKDGAVHPAVALIIHRIGALQIGEAAVLRLEGRLQVGRVVNGMRKSVAGEQLKALGKALREVEGHGVVPGVAVGQLRIHAVEGDGYTEAPRVAFRRGIPE